VVVIEFSVALCLVIMIALAALLMRTRQQLWEARGARALLDTVPLASFRWRAGEVHNGKGLAASYAEFLASLAQGDAAQLEVARVALQSTGTPFSTTVGTRSGGAYLVEGRRAATREDVLWLADASTAAIAQSASE
jgi:hypothetical protein